MGVRPRVITHRIRRHDEHGPDRLKCSICGWPAVDIRSEPGTSLQGDFAFDRSGDKYVWDNPGESLDVIDREVFVVGNVTRTCPWCIGQRFLDGSKGSAHSVPGF